jgi:hypothetical protein
MVSLGNGIIYLEGMDVRVGVCVYASESIRARVRV